VWRESNLFEMQKLDKPLCALMLRLRHLLSLYPSHPILLQLIRLTHRISALPSSSCIKLVLTGIEILLQKAEEWESYASKEVSIKTELYSMSILVARWRKMELHGWPNALNEREEKSQNEALKWWFRLYALVHTDPDQLYSYLHVQSKKEYEEKMKKRFTTGLSDASLYDGTEAAAAAATASSSDGLSANNSFTPDNYVPRAFKDLSKQEKETATCNFIDRLYTVLEEFMLYSSVGQFKIRLDILQSLYFHISVHLTVTDDSHSNGNSKHDQDSLHSHTIESTPSDQQQESVAFKIYLHT
jgi:midasin